MVVSPRLKQKPNKARSLPSRQQTAVEPVIPEERFASPVATVLLPENGDTWPENPQVSTTETVLAITSGNLRPVIDGEVTTIAGEGDVILDVSQDTGSRRIGYRFRVCSAKLSASSRYFTRLFSADGFGEGKRIKAELELLRSKYDRIEDISDEHLPVVDILDAGRISNVRSIVPLLSDLFNVLHGKDIQAHAIVGNLANLAIVADRFDALEPLKVYVRRKKLIPAVDGRLSSKQDAVLTEEKVRQRVLVGLLLNHSAWVSRFTARLITKGWVGGEADTDSPLWWDLPQRIEEEVAFRRRCVLDTIRSLQAHYLQQYSSRERQCKLGYDSSAQCDSFQLGEMVRFFTKAGVLDLRSTILQSDPPQESYQDDLLSLLDTLRQVPEYQIDRNHVHCGIRTRILPKLDTIQALVTHVGICGECWQRDRDSSRWIDSHPHVSSQLRSSAQVTVQCPTRHVDVRPFFHATEHRWGDDGR